MDGHLAIEHNREALKRILLSLLAMAGGNAALSRYLQRSILWLLRPAESATRRLIIALSRGIAVTVPPARGQKPYAALQNSRLQTGTTPPASATAPASLPLLDPLCHAVFRPWVRQTAIPRICVPGLTDPCPIPVRPTLQDSVDASRLGCRLAALSSALDDLPRQALRFARWQARRTVARNSGRARRRWPLRAGRPPGWRQSSRHEIFEVLDHANRLAHWALAHPDSS